LNFSSRLSAALARARQELLAARTPDGPWAGELSSSALSTATAVCALSIVEKQNPALRPADCALRITQGLNWLAVNANVDGGWGDTILSRSNISTTALCWAAFGMVAGADQKYHEVIAGAESWLIRNAGGLDPDHMAGAILRRYGKDRTFSVPILLTCALAGRLGPDTEAWGYVSQLPFELAACPRQWFAALRLPVVSYALPALIAIGQARHQHRPSRNPLTRMLRNLARRRTLKVLADIQPDSGGFLEATPLTSFVTMSLAASGQVRHPVTERAMAFLLDSARADGSWAIDSNLATWVTTLSVKALARGSLEALTIDDRRSILDWLLDQQFQTKHPYTCAAPGGWAWTDLPGGVPDADDTAGALLALRMLGALNSRVRMAANAGVNWLLQLQNRDGGIPTFCRGWTNLPFDRSSPDLTAHAVRAWSAWQDKMPAPTQSGIRAAIGKTVGYLRRTQRQDGSWIPLWFGNQDAPEDANATYGTAKVLMALDEPTLRQEPATQLMRSRGARYLLDTQRNDGSWGGALNTPASVEESGLAVEALAGIVAANRALESGLRLDLARTAPAALTLDAGAIHEAVMKGAGWLMEQIESGGWTTPAPIGFYFAKLWYYERLYPLIFAAGALGRVAKVLSNEKH
jgi:squalene-hopene/tetraprenyl-beta-curcumene cyclase